MLFKIRTIPDSFDLFPLMRGYNWMLQEIICLNYIHLFLKVGGNWNELMHNAMIYLYTIQQFYLDLKWREPKQYIFLNPLCFIFFCTGKYNFDKKPIQSRPEQYTRWGNIRKNKALDSTIKQEKNFNLSNICLFMFVFLSNFISFFVCFFSHDFGGYNVLPFLFLILDHETIKRISKINPRSTYTLVERLPWSHN